jgi:hypothetical protein
MPLKNEHVGLGLPSWFFPLTDDKAVAAHVNWMAFTMIDARTNRWRTARRWRSGATAPLQRLRTHGQRFRDARMLTPFETDAAFA